MRQEVAYYSALTNDEVNGTIESGPESLIMCAGTVLVSFPPPEEETKGGIVIPEKMRKSQDIGRVLSTPLDDKCPVHSGDLVICRHMAGDPIKLFGRNDLRFLQYTEDAGSEILAFVPGESESWNAQVRRVCL